MGRLILVEGIPGSGKTTISKKIADYLSDNKKTNYYEEGDSHPADLAWCACIPKDQFSNILEQYSAYEKSIRECMYEEADYIVVPYTRFSINDPTFYQKMESFEVYDNRVGYDTFVDLHRKKWIRFAQKAKVVDEYTVFECSFLQNHINELMLFHCKEDSYIEEYLLSLIDTVRDLNPVLFYLNQKDINETLERVSAVRVDGKGNRIWMERVIDYIENSPYGKLHHLKGFDGMVRYFADRKVVEMKVISKLPIDTFIINNEDYNWEQVWKSIDEILEKIKMETKD